MTEIPPENTRPAHEPSGAAAARRRLLTSPGERRDVDYKSSLPYVAGTDFALKLLRHVQGFANTGGGWIVIGFRPGSTGLLEADPAHSDRVASTYEPTTLSQDVSSSIARGQQLFITVYQEQHPDTRLRYPIIEVHGFGRSPYVCRSASMASDTGKAILEQGAVYLRRPSAETSKVSTPEDWESLISRAVRNRRDEFLGELRELLDQMISAPAPGTPALDPLGDWTRLEHRRAFGEEEANE